MSPLGVDWKEIQAFLGVVVILFTGGAWIQSLWLKGKLTEVEIRFTKHVDATYMPAHQLTDKFKQVNRRIDKLQSPPVEDKLEALRLSVVHLTKSVEERG